MSRCDCCDLPVESCGKALEQRERAAEKAYLDRLLSQPGWFWAKFPGFCVTCHERFPANVPIKPHGEGYMGPCCGPELQS